MDTTLGQYSKNKKKIDYCSVNKFKMFKSYLDIYEIHIQFTIVCLGLYFTCLHNKIAFQKKQHNEID